MAKSTTRRQSAMSSVANVSSPKAKSNMPDVASLRADMLATMDKIAANETTNVKLTQRVAWDIMRYRDTESTPLAFGKMKADGKALSSWRSALRVMFLGKAPVVGKEKTNTKLDARKAYMAKAATFDAAATFVVAAGLRGIGSEHFSESLGCFMVHPSMLLRHGYIGMWALKEAIDENRNIALDNTRYDVTGKNKDGQTVYTDAKASIRQVLAVFNEKPVAPAVTAHNAAVQAAVKGANESNLIDPAVIKNVLKNAGIERLAFAMRDALNADNALPHTRADFEADTWNCMMSVAQRIMAIANASDLKDAKAVAA